MRNSNRDSILDAAIRVINRDGITAVTFDNVAAESGVTRGGLQYHFSSRDALIAAINQHLAAHWEESLVALAGKPDEQTTELERYAAYVRNSANTATRAEMLFLLEFSTHPTLATPWNRIIERWAPPHPDTHDEPAATARFTARLAAEGLWSYAFISNQHLPDDARARLAASLAEMIIHPIVH